MKQQWIDRITYGLDRIADAYEVRMEVFVEEQGFSEDLEKDAQDASSYHLVLFDGAIPIATARCFPNHGEAYKIGRVAVRKAYRGKDLGLLLMSRMEEEIKKLGGRSAFISAQTQAVGFYERAGYVAFGETYLDEHCPHQDMKKEW